MRHLAAIFLSIMIAGAVRVNAQDPPPRIGTFVVDLRATIPLFPND